MDTNRILLLMVGFACGLMIVRHVRGHPGHRGWLAVSVTVAVTIAALHFLAPTVAGYLGMAIARRQRSETPRAPASRNTCRPSRSTDRADIGVSSRVHGGLL